MALMDALVPCGCALIQAGFLLKFKHFPCVENFLRKGSIAAIPRSLSTLSSVQSVAFDGSNRFLAVAGQDTG